MACYMVMDACLTSFNIASIGLREDRCRLRVFENMMLMSIF
jgi:hypothetical protein